MYVCIHNTLSLSRYSIYLCMYTWKKTISYILHLFLFYMTILVCSLMFYFRPHISIVLYFLFSYHHNAFINLVNIYIIISHSDHCDVWTFLTVVPCWGKHKHINISSFFFLIITCYLSIFWNAFCTLFTVVDVLPSLLHWIAEIRPIEFELAQWLIWKCNFDFLNIQCHMTCFSEHVMYI